VSEGDGKPRHSPIPGAAPPFPKGKSGNPNGRPKGSKSKSTLFREQVEEWRARKAAGEKSLTPLDLFQMFMDDPMTPKSMRMRAAEAAAPYIHSKLPMRMPMDDPNDTFAKVRAALREMGQRSNGIASPPPEPPKPEEPK
jgi:hypothetical protein